MRNLQAVRPSRRLWILGIMFCVVMAALLAFPTASANGARDGMSLAFGVFIPAMFPYFVMTAFLTKSGVNQLFERILSPLCHLLKLPCAAAGVLVMGLLGGYPAGAAAAGDLVSQGVLSDKEAERLMKFCVNSGPGFVMGAVGAIMLRSPLAGILLYAAHLIPSVLIAAVTAAFAPRNKPQGRKEPKKQANTAQALVDSARTSAFSVLFAAAFITLFCTLIGLLVGTGLLMKIASVLGISSDTVLAGVSSLFEVSKGCASAALLKGIAAPVFAAFALGFGGLSVACQVFSFLPFQMRALPYLGTRLLHGTLSALIAYLLFSLRPEALATFSGPVLPVQISLSMAPQVSAAVMLLCCLLITAIEKKRNL